MKPLKKHPKQQRMEEMTFPIIKPSKKKIQEYTMYPCPHGNTGFDICVECRDEAMAKWIKTNHPVMFRFGKCFYHPKEPAVIQSGTPEYNLCKKCREKRIHKDTISVFNNLDQDIQKDMLRAVEVINKEKVTTTGREYLRSINDDNGFTLMPRIVWRVVAVVILVIICLVIIL